MIPSYSKIYAVGHRAARELFTVNVHVQEKVDGSQFSFRRDMDTVEFRSKGAEVYSGNAGMFAAGVASAIGADSAHGLMPGWVYRGEYLMRPKHNVLTYARVPQRNVALFDIVLPDGNFLPPELVRLEAERLGFDCVPTFHTGAIRNAEEVRELLDRESFLGGCKIEGLVFKPEGYRLLDTFTGARHVLMAKFVSEAFKEVHRATSKDSQTAFRGHLPKDIVERLSQKYGTAQRWTKALQHLREAGQIKGAPEDIGPLMAAVWPDIVEECKADIMDELWAWASKQLARGTTKGLPEWYKQKLLDDSFEREQINVD